MIHRIQDPPLFLAVSSAACSLLVAGALSLSGEHTVPPPKVPAPTFSAEHGRQLFVQSCAHCHGNDARGEGEDGDGPDLFALRIGNARIAAVIRTGIPDEMPAFAKKYGPAEIGDLRAYLRTLR